MAWNVLISIKSREEKNLQYQINIVQIFLFSYQALKNPKTLPKLQAGETSIRCVEHYEAPALILEKFIII